MSISPNDRIGTLVALRKLDIKGQDGSYAWEWLCDCGLIVIKHINHAKRVLKSCGYSCKIKNVNIVGQKFGRLTVSKIFRRNNRTYCESSCECGKIIIVRHDQIKSGNTKSCSCLATEILSSRSGINHPRYKGDPESILTRAQRDGIVGKKWIRLIKERDNHTCQICGSKEDIEAHHINSYTTFPKQRNDLDNGIILCYRCHKTFEKQHSYPATRQKFLEFLLLIHKGRGHCDYIYSDKWRNSMERLEKEYLDNIGAE